MKPEDRIAAYLATNKSKLEHSTVDAAVKTVKLSVFYGMSPISDDEIRKIIVKWATFNAAGMLVRDSTINTPTAQLPAGDPPPSSSDFIDAVKKAITAVNNGVTIGSKGTNFNIGVTGPTANLKRGDNSVSLGISWTGTLKLKTQSGPFHFEGNLSKDSWELMLSFPQDTYIPDMASLGKVFSEGEKAIGKVADATRSFNNISDSSKVGALIKPHVGAIENAVDAVSGIANAPRKGGASFGFKVGSPDPGLGQQGMPGGVQGQVVFTFVF